MRYQLGLYEKSMPAELTLAERLAAVRDAGFDHLDMSVDETEERQARLAWSAAERAEVRRAVITGGVRPEAMPEIVPVGPDIVISGSGIIKAPDPAVAARAIKEAMPA